MGLTDLLTDEQTGVNQREAFASNNNDEFKGLKLRERCLAPCLQERERGEQVGADLPQGLPQPPAPAPGLPPPPGGATVHCGLTGGWVQKFKASNLAYFLQCALTDYARGKV